MTPFNATLIHVARLELINLRTRVDAALAALAPLLDLPKVSPEEHEAAPAPESVLFIPAGHVPVDAPAPAVKKPRQTWDIAAATAAMEALDAQIINIVRDTQPAKPNAVAAAVDGKTSIVRARIQLLVKAGRLVADGATSNRVLRLPAPGTTSGGVPLPAPGTTSGGVPSVESSVDMPLAGVESPDATAERDAAILTLVKRGPKTFDDLLRGLTTKPADVSADAFRILVKRSLRRLIMRGELVDVGDKFKAVL